MRSIVLTPPFNFWRTVLLAGYLVKVISIIHGYQVTWQLTVVAIFREEFPLCKTGGERKPYEFWLEGN